MQTNTHRDRIALCSKDTLVTLGLFSTCDFTELDRDISNIAKYQCRNSCHFHRMHHFSDHGKRNQHEIQVSYILANFRLRFDCNVTSLPQLCDWPCI